MQPSQPLLSRFWVKVLQDGKTAIPQFDLETGAPQPWGTPAQDLSRVLLLPFSSDLVDKVVKQGGLAVASTLPIVEVYADHGEQIRLMRENDIETNSSYRCTKCGHMFKWMGGSPLECPQCGAVNEWYCSVCDEIKNDPVFFDNGEVRCPDCAEPQGLKRTEVLQFVQHPPKHTYIYKIEVGDRIKIEVSEAAVRVI